MEHGISFFKKIGNFISNILLGETKEIIIRTDERVKIISSAVDGVQRTIDDFRTSIATHGANITALQIHTKYGINNSPTVPNENGTKLLKDSHFEEQYPKFKEKLFILMDTMNLRTPYDYENGAIDALKKLQSDSLFDPIKDYVVSNPDTSLELIFKVASWIIREEYQQHKK